MAKEIWTPKSELRATVRDGNVIVWDEMKFEARPVNSQAGFRATPGTSREDMRRDTMRPAEPPPHGAP